MTGNDCKRLEAGISTFLTTLLKSSIGETFHHISATRLAVLNRIVQDFADIAHNLRSTTTTKETVGTFQQRVEKMVHHLC